jgi:hypothetical protein
VCLPNELVIDVYTNLEDDEFIPDSILEWYYVFNNKWKRLYNLKNYSFLRSDLLCF